MAAVRVMLCGVHLRLVEPSTQVPPQLSGSFGIIMQWADEVRDMKALT